MLIMILLLLHGYKLVTTIEDCLSEMEKDDELLNGKITVELLITRSFIQT